VLDRLSLSLSKNVHEWACDQFSIARNLPSHG